LSEREKERDDKWVVFQSYAFMNVCILCKISYVFSKI
jgi:hypothetical protein